MFCTQVFYFCFRRFLLLQGVLCSLDGVESVSGRWTDAEVKPITKSYLCEGGVVYLATATTVEQGVTHVNLVHKQGML